MSQIELIGLSKSYDGKIQVIKDVSLEIARGEFVILVGPSGCGKSTLLRMIAGLESIDSGTLKIDGKVANQMMPKDRNLSMVFQNYALFPHMTVAENIIFGLDVKKVPKQERQERLHTTAEMVGLTEYLQRKPGQLSGGQRQRVALARSICSKAPICLMDEPLSNLDAKLRTQMRSDIRRIQRQLGLTIVYVTHDQVEAMTMGDRIVVLDQGVIQQIGTPMTLYNKPVNRFVASFIGSPPINMLEGVVRGNELHLNGAAAVPLREELRGTVTGKNALSVGVRAEHLGCSQARTEYSLAVKVVNVEFMGNETQVLFTLGDKVYTAKWAGQWSVQPEDVVFVEFSPEQFYFFDMESGALLHAPEFSDKNVLTFSES